MEGSKTTHYVAIEVTSDNEADLDNAFSAVEGKASLKLQKRGKQVNSLEDGLVEFDMMPETE